MPITFQCPDCGQIFSVAPDKAGRKGPCSGCGAVLIVPDLSQDKAVERLKDKGISVPPDPPPLPVKVVSSAGWFSLKTLLVAMTAISAALGFFSTLHQPGIPSTVGHYVALVLLMLTLIYAVRVEVKNQWLLGGLVAFMVAVAGVAAVNDYSIEYWTSTQDGMRSEYTDYRNRWKGTIYYRHATKVPIDSNHPLLVSATNQGPMCDTEKGHGHWKMEMIMKKSVSSAVWESLGCRSTNGVVGNRDEWLWYGEEITEGEWVLRNK